MKAVVLITVYNEEKRIAQKLDNTLEIDYPAELLEIIVVSDASGDRTEEIVEEYASKGIKLMVVPGRNGKQ